MRSLTPVLLPLARFPFYPAVTLARCASWDLDSHMNIQTALEAPFFIKLHFGGCDAMIDDRVPMTFVVCSSRRVRCSKCVPTSPAGWGGHAVTHNSAAGLNYALLASRGRNCHSRARLILSHGQELNT